MVHTFINASNLSRGTLMMAGESIAYSLWRPKDANIIGMMSNEL